MPRGRQRSGANASSNQTDPVNKPKKRGRKNPEDEDEVEQRDETESSLKNDQPASKRKKINKTEGAPEGPSADDAPEKDDPADNDNIAEKDVADDGKDPSKDKPGKPLMNKSSTNFDEINFHCDRKNAAGKTSNLKISTWNVDGLRAWLKKGGLEFLKYEKPDILCLQETKCSKEKLPKEVTNVSGYHTYWVSGEKEGYAGVGLLSKQEPSSVKYGLSEEFDSEGRIITAEYDKFYLISTYVPNSGRGLVTLPKRLEWNKAFKSYIKKLDSKKPVIVCGDMNVSHLEIDLANPKSNKKSAGFTQEERDGMTEFLEDGFVDTFRNLYPDKTGSYTYWTYMSNCRKKNVGWRLDYAIVSEKLKKAVCDNIIRSEVYGSDHCPITLFLHV